MNKRSRVLTSFYQPDVLFVTSFIKKNQSVIEQRLLACGPGGALPDVTSDRPNWRAYQIAATLDLLL